MKLFLLLAACAMLMAETPQAVMDVFRAAGEALANQDSVAFMDQFDKNMPGYDKLRAEIEELVAEDVSSTVDVITDEGDDQKRLMQLDWVLSIDNREPKRAIVRCQVERKGKKWQISSLEPVEFFRK